MDTDLKHIRLLHAGCRIGNENSGTTNNTANLVAHSERNRRACQCQSLMILDEKVAVRIPFDDQDIVKLTYF